MVLCFAASACDPAPTPLGTACDDSDGCTLIGQSCVKGICTRSCAGDYGELGCPSGFTCGRGDAPDQYTCNKVRYAVDAQGEPLLFGKPCGHQPQVCSNTGDPHPAPLCRRAIELYTDPPVAQPYDPNAYCTGTCGSDDDCPIRMTCSVDFDGVKKCLQRERCAPCTLNDQCPLGGVCASIDDGKEKYCTTPCGSDYDCPGRQQGANYYVCKLDLDVQGNEVKLCAHRYGACVGDGRACAPCRAHSDCQSGVCYYDEWTGERFCEQACKSPAECAGSHGAVCDSYIDICANGETGSLGHPTCWP